jgi:hypothetical protein
MALRWENPPERAYGTGRPKLTEDEKAAAAMRRHPGRWLLLRADANSSLAYQIKTGQNRAFQPAGAFEAVARGIKTGNGSRGKIYCRYIGEGDGDE